MREPAEGHWLLAWEFVASLCFVSEGKTVLPLQWDFPQPLREPVWRAFQQSGCGLPFKVELNIDLEETSIPISILITFTTERRDFPPTISGIVLRKHFRNSYSGKCYSHPKERDAFSSVPSNHSHNNITWAQVEQAVRVYHYHLRKGKRVLPSES